MNKFEYVSSSGRGFDLPTRATAKSAGYDFHSPVAFDLKPGEIKEIKLEVKVQLNEREVLWLVPRSSLGWKYNVKLVNTVGIIDGDYYNNPENEGEIVLKLHNQGDKTLHVAVNDRLIQGIFLNFNITDDDAAQGERLGGFGSTGGQH